MSVLVLSCGRTGTNLLLEVLRGSTHLRATQIAEDKTLFHYCPDLRKDYLSKCDTVYVKTLQRIDALFNRNPNLKVLWTIRDLRDTALSKIYRGQPGHDTPILADDATLEGCLDDLKWMTQVYRHIEKKYPDRIKVVKMEDMILQFDNTLEEICSFLEIPVEGGMKDFIGRYRNDFKAQRYKKLDKSQVGLYNRVNEIYGGFFKTHDIDLKVLFERLQPYLKEFKYI